MTSIRNTYESTSCQLQTHAVDPRHASGQALINWQELLITWDHDHQFVSELLGLFLHQLPKQRNDVATSLTDGDPESLVTAAHALKGSLLAVMACPTAALALTLETMGREKALVNAVDLWRQLEDELDRLTVAVRHFCQHSIRLPVCGS